MGSKFFIIFLATSGFHSVNLQQIASNRNSNFETGGDGSHERIVGGTNSFLGEFPWIGLLYLGNGNSISSACGSSLLNTEWVLTAAHCTYGYGASSVHVRLGVYDQSNPESTSRLYSILAIYNHEFYSTSPLQNDISLLKVNGQVELNSQVQPITLPTSGASPSTGENCIIIGWGTLINGASTTSDLLQKATVPIVSNSQCNAWLGSDGITIVTTQLCAGFEAGQVDTCQGDSGGPLVCQNILQGITSFGVGCAQFQRPGVYTKVSEFVTWINTTMSTTTSVTGSGGTISIHQAGLILCALLATVFCW